MAEIRPFRGTHYNQALIDDLTSVICPPYDIISPQRQQELYLRSEYNFVRVEFGRELPQDGITDNKYARAAATLEQWLKRNILMTDEVPAIYLHDQFFTHDGKEYQRRGITVRVRLEEWDKMVVRPHEGTFASPRNDRLSLLWTLEANTSPILAMFEDRGQQVSSLLASQKRGQPLLSLRDVDGEGHTLWAITDPAVIQQMGSRLNGQPLYIADGHHRYESALAYRRERLTSDSSVAGNEPFNFVMMTLVDFADPGLVILPPHRLVRGIAKSVLNGLMAKLNVFFDIVELPVSMPDLWTRFDDLLAEANEVRLGIFGLTAEHLLVLTLRDPAAVGQMMPYFHSELYKRLDVSIVDHVLLEKLLMLGDDKDNSLVDYSYDRVDAIKRVIAQEYQLAFLLKPVKTEVIKAIADAGDKLPKKSTYFYPKLPAGLVVNRLV